MDFPGDSVVKNMPVKATDTGDMGLIPASGRSPREENGNALHYSCLDNSMDRGAWQATVHGVTKRQTRLSDSHIYIYIAQRTIVNIVTVCVRVGKEF